MIMNMKQKKGKNTFEPAKSFTDKDMIKKYWYKIDSIKKNKSGLEAKNNIHTKTNVVKSYSLKDVLQNKNVRRSERLKNNKINYFAGLIMLFTLIVPLIGIEIKDEFFICEQEEFSKMPIVNLNPCMSLGGSI